MMLMALPIQIASWRMDPLQAVIATIPIRTVAPEIKRVAIQSTRTATRRL
jgi:hypothetical protein